MPGYRWSVSRKWLPAQPIRATVHVIGATSFHGKDLVHDTNQDGANKDAIIRFSKKVRAKFGKQKITIVLNHASSRFSEK